MTRTAFGAQGQEIADSDTVLMTIVSAPHQERCNAFLAKQTIKDSANLFFRRILLARLATDVPNDLLATLKDATLHLSELRWRLYALIVWAWCAVRIGSFERIITNRVCESVYRKSGLPLL